MNQLSPDHPLPANRLPRPWLWLLLACFCSQLAHGHDARPVAVTIAETLPGIYQATLHVPPTVEAGNQPVVVWPPGCEPLAADTGATTLMRCDSGLAGQGLALEYPAFNPSLATYYRLTTLGGLQAAAMLAPTQERWAVPMAMTAGSVARDYLLLGIGHIIGGPDHLLFVLGLLVLARTPQRILLTITGFTLAHSITLSLSSLGLLAVPIVPVEAAIALSILFLAQEISKPRHASLTWRFPLLVAFGFGLLHGLGFASALGEIGLVQHEVLVSLLFFNLGVETGQVLFIAGVLLLVLCLRRVLPQCRAGLSPGSVLSLRVNLAAAYVIGIPSAYWLFERVAWLLP